VVIMKGADDAAATTTSAEENPRPSYPYPESF
jgi:hypothetical protein